MPATAWSYIKSSSFVEYQTCVELDEEKARHARDMEQGDNVTYMLEKDRERLKQEVHNFIL